MKRLLAVCTLIITILFSTAAKAQIADPVKWTFTAAKTKDCEAELTFRAKIDGAWHLYGQKSYGDEGPVPTSFKITKSPDFELIGKPTESNLIKKFEPVWGFEINYFEHEGVFRQKIKVKSNKPFEIKGTLEFMVCNETNCLPPSTVEYTFKIDNSMVCSDAASAATATTANTNTTEAAACVCDSAAIACAYHPKETKTETPASTASTTVSQSPKSTDTKPDTDASARSWWSLLITGFLGGLAALLTPCVFPMIPMTVTFFTKRSKTRAKGISNAITYGLAIIVIYVLLGLGVSIAFGPDALNALSTNVWFNLFFFVLLVVFAVSFLGAFEIVLPSRFVNSMDEKSDKGGLLGIFFMAFTLSLVSFSCTGPIIGTLLVDAAVNGGIKGPFWGMFGFSAALALPFALFAAFPGWLNTLPKSGGWLNSVKVVLGFLELALAFKFASNADLVVQAGILTREVFITLWIVIFGLMGIYLMGWFKLPHDSDVKHISVGRLMFAVVALSFTVYLIPGLWGAPLKLISGFPPPDFYSESPNGFGGSKNTLSLNSAAANDNGTKEHCPNNLPCFHDYDEALAYAKKVKKPLMIDFTGWACVNCRKMESQVWTDPEVDKRLRNDVVLVSLYVDEKTELPADQQTVKKLGDRDFKIQTIGNKWSYMQANIYKTNMQPQYVLIDGNEQMLTAKTTTYDPDVKKYVDWLDEGIAAYKKNAK